MEVPGWLVAKGPPLFFWDHPHRRQALRRPSHAARRAPSRKRAEIGPAPDRKRQRQGIDQGDGRGFIPAEHQQLGLGPGLAPGSNMHVLRCCRFAAVARWDHSRRSPPIRTEVIRVSGLEWSSLKDPGHDAAQGLKVANATPPTNAAPLLRLNKSKLIQCLGCKK